MNIIPHLYLLGTFQGIFLAVSLSGRTHRAGNFLIALLLISSGYFLFEYLVHERYLDRYPHLIGIYLPVLFLVPPLLYLMVRSEVYRTDGFGKESFFHFAPFLVSLGMMLPYYQKSADEKQQILFTHTEAYSLYPFSQELAISLWLLALGYVVVALRLFKKANLKKVKWLKNYIFLFLALLLVFLISEVVVRLGIFHHYYFMTHTIAVFSLAIHFVGYSALKETRFMKGASSHNIPLSPKQKQDLKLDLIRILEEEKAFTSQSLSSVELCEKLNTNSKYLSAVVNEEFKCSITSLINSYRVNEAKRMLEDSSYKHLNFLGIALSVGFSNKNSFTRAFRRHTGTNPSAFRGSTS